MLVICEVFCRLLPILAIAIFLTQYYNLEASAPGSVQFVHLDMKLLHVGLAGELKAIAEDLNQVV